MCACAKKHCFHSVFQSNLSHHDYAYTTFRRCRCCCHYAKQTTIFFECITFDCGFGKHTLSSATNYFDAHYYNLFSSLFFFHFVFLNKKLHCSVSHLVIQLWNLVAKTSIFLNIHSLEVMITTEFVYDKWLFSSILFDWVCRKRIGLVYK